MKHLIVKSDHDNVGNALEAVPQGEVVAWEHGTRQGSFPAREPIPFGFKVALEPLSAGADIVGYGEVIGVATRDILPGDLVHIHNMAGKRGLPGDTGDRA